MKKKLLFITNYYYPYISGITEYVRLLCEGLAKEDYDVTILTANHAKLPKKEIINGVRVIRAPIIGKISKGTVSPAFIVMSRRLSKDYDIINLHLPMLESGIIASIAKNKNIISTYHCDINLPVGIINYFITKVMDLSHNICLRKSRSIMVTSKDYAFHSRIAYKYKDKMVEVSPPIKAIKATENKAAHAKKAIGFCGRIVEEKGIDVLLEAFSIISKRRDDVQLLIGGDYTSIAGGSIYHSLLKIIEKYQISDVTFLGKIPEEKMADFYSSLDVFVLPSKNSLEAFGLVQVEAMRCGTPVVATDLYGVRTVVQTTGMGLVCRKNDENDLAACIMEILDNRQKYIKPLDVIESFFSIEKSIHDCEQVFSCFE